MKTVGLTYSDGETHHSSERFVSKVELREIFPDTEFVSLSIQYRKRFFRKKSCSDESGKKGSKKKKKKSGYGQLSREKRAFKHKVVWLR